MDGGRCKYADSIGIFVPKARSPRLLVSWAMKPLWRWIVVVVMLMVKWTVTRVIARGEESFMAVNGPGSRVKEVVSNGQIDGRKMS